MIGIFIVSLLIFISNGFILDNVYSGNFTFRLAQSPYYINRNVTFQNTSNVFIENGVDIIFSSGFSMITIHGNINSGCYDFDTTSINTKGLADSSQYIHIYQSSGAGLISINYTGNYTHEIKFCNTKFSNLDYGLKLESPLYNTNVVIDNCLFYDVLYGLYNKYESKSSLSWFTDTQFIDVYVINNIGGAIYDNCEFDAKDKYFCSANYGKYSSCCKDISITHSTKINAAVKVYYSDDNYYEISNNIFTSSKYGIVILPNYGNKSNNNLLNISNNIFTNISTYGILIYEQNVLIENNSFIDNEFDYAIFCDPQSTNNIHNITITGNTFNRNRGIMKWRGFKIIMTYFCGDRLKITDNIFINNSAYELIFTKDAMLAHNQFINNNASYMTYHVGNVILNGNYFASNTVSDEFINIGDFNAHTYLKNNVFIKNTITSNFTDQYGNPLDIMIDVYSNFVSFTNNSFINNKFLNSAGGDLINVYYNFEIKSNTFYSNFANNNIDAYINMDTPRIVSISQNSSKIIKYNNFYDSDNINYFISNHNQVVINAQNNYFDAFTEYDYIASKMYDHCDVAHRGQIKFWPWFSNKIGDVNIDATKCKLLTSFSCNYKGSVFCGETLSPTVAPTQYTSNAPTKYTSNTSNPTTNTPTTRQPTENNVITTVVQISSKLFNTLQTTSITNACGLFNPMFCVLFSIAMSYFM